MASELVANVLEFTPTTYLPNLALVYRGFTSLVLPRLYRSILYGMLA
jgi:hypothetical protein